MEEQRNVAKKRRLDAANQDLSDGAGAGSPDVDVDVGPPRMAKKAAGGPGDTCGGTVLATEEPRVPGREKPITATGISPPAAQAAEEYRVGAAGTIDADTTVVDASSPSAAPCRRRNSTTSSDGRRAVDPGDRMRAARLSKPPCADRSLPRRDALRAAAVAHRPEGPLSAEDIAKFEEDGFVMLKQAFSSEVAAACRESLWKRLRGEGITRGDPSTWVRKVGLAEIYGMSSSPKKRRGAPWKDALSSRLTSALEQLLGPGAWEEFGCGWWVVTFPGFARPPWGAEGKWHCDGAHFRHYPHSREIGLLPIFLFSDVKPHGGGTAVIRGSHKTVAELLWNQAGTKGLTGPELSSAARGALLPTASEDVVETTGSAGDVLLTHPLLLHARSTNLAPVEEAGVRFMCHPAVPLKRHLDLHAPPETFSVVERVMWRACPSRWRNGGGSHAIPKPEQCDHSPVELPSKKGHYWKKKGKPSSKGCRGAREPAPREQDSSTEASSPTFEAPDGLVVEPAPKGAEAGQPTARSEQPDKECGSQDGRASHCRAANRSTGEEDAGGEAQDWSGSAEGVDSAVMEAMGFGSFGGPGR